jgi:hypothetical protein
MANREEALRRIFEATLPADRLGDEQRRELLAHLDDAVEAKVAGGVPEMEAVGRAFEELGDLKKIAQSFPAPAAPALATTTGVRVYPWAEHGYFLLLFFAFAQFVIAPKLIALFPRTRVAMPGLTLMFWEVGRFMRDQWWATAVTLLMLAWALVRYRKSVRWRMALDLGYGVAGILLFVGIFVSVVLPFVTLLEGLSARR